jgi:hypothetical protein
LAGNIPVVVILTQWYMPVFAKSKKDAEDQKSKRDNQIKPPKVGGGRLQHSSRSLGEEVGRKNAKQNDHKNDE